jgi:dienelactone hydrolase
VTRRSLIAAVATTCVVASVLAEHSTARGWSLVARAANHQGISRRLADLGTVPIVERLIFVPIHNVPTWARMYGPVAHARQTVLLVSGLHPAGIDEPRLIALARELAKTNVTVVTPDIPELSRFEITPLLTDRIEDAAVWLATESGWAPTGRIGLMGVSFSGGLAVVAAGRPALRNRLRYVFSFGGHDDLPRVLGYLCRGSDSADAHDAGDSGMTGPPAPHDYGLAIALLNVADQLVPSDQVLSLRAAVRRFLQASYIDRTDDVQAEREFAALRQLASMLPEPSATLLTYVNNRDVAHLGPRLRLYVDRYAEAAALSPARSPYPSAPVFLLHGRDDNVIPSTESEYLANRQRTHGRVRLLVTDVISHADADRPPHLRDVGELARFWGDLLTR